MNNHNLNDSNKILKDEMKNITGHLDFDMNEYIQKRPEGLENTKKLLTNFDKLSKGEQPKLIPLQSFTSSHLQELMVPVVKAVQSTVGKMKKLDLEQRMREVRFTTEHTLTPEQREKLIQEKLERARLELETRKRVENQLLA